MEFTYRMFFQYWGRGLLIAALIAAVSGLLLGSHELVIHLYQAAVILLVLSILFLLVGKKMPEKDNVK